MQPSQIKKSLFGQTGVELTRVGLGGEGVLRTHNRAAEARQVIREAIGQGIGYFDCARVYADSELYYGAVWGPEPEQRSRIFQTSKSPSRTKAEALRDLEESLERLQVSHLDLWQIHDVRTVEELETIAGPGGALEAFVQAKQDGRARFIGVTGHHDPDILTRAVQEWPVDSVLLPVNPAEAVLGGFMTETLPAARQKSIAVIGMKILGGSHYVRPENGLTPDLLIRYALSFDIDVAIVGCSTPEEVQTLADMGRVTEPMTPQEKDTLTRLFEPYAARLAFYRSRI